MPDISYDNARIAYSSEDSLHKSTVVDLLDLRSSPVMSDSAFTMARSRKDGRANGSCVASYST